ncbi:hypothetical protein SS50377_23453 [Spironucleus salmonicida]|uniref:Uncharacterized protein n=1 Tax=Spironucleus salmonicida TaxID=348837 RepID=V6LNL7_9EUKA|nr:hypothetical protein SS50377_23453 [Spironucleus salmonicida]|eukprot:EST46190.1 hypothetical protein SS50377_13785 [Spironucleus salmonicida]
MDIIQGLYSQDVLVQQTALQQLNNLNASQVLQIYMQTQDIIILSCLKVQQLNNNDFIHLEQSIHTEKISQIFAQYACICQQNFDFIYNFLQQLKNIKLQIYIIKELLQLRISQTQQIYEFSVTLQIHDFDDQLVILDCTSQYCQLNPKHFEYLLTEQFLLQGIEDKNIQKFAIVINQIFNKFKYSSKECRDSSLLKQTFLFLIQHLNCEHYYKYGIIMISTLFLVMQNRHLYFFDLYVSYLKFSIFVLSNFNHFNCHLIIPSLIKLYESRQIQQCRNIYYQLVNDNKRLEQYQTLTIMIQPSLNTIGLTLNEIQDYDENIDILTIQLLKILSAHVDKRSIQGLVKINNFFENDCNLQSHEQLLYLEYNTIDPLFWQDWFGQFRGQVTQLISKIAIVYPQQCLNFCKDILTESWRQISFCNRMVTMKDDEYLNIDLAIVFTDPIIQTIMKLMLNENDYVKQTLLNLDTYQLVVDLLLIDQFKQPVIIYKTLSTACQIPRFITKIEQSILMETNTKQQLPFNNQKQLLYKYQMFCSILIKKTITKLFENINFRLQDEQSTEAEYLFQNLSQDTLALRRMIVTKLNSYLQSKQICILLTDIKENPDTVDYNFDLLSQFVNFIEDLKIQQVITETEILNLNLCQLSILINIQTIDSLSSTAEQFKERLNIMLNNIISDLELYFSQKLNLQALENLQFFSQFFSLNNTTFDLISKESIQIKRQFLFKINEALIIIPRITQLIKSQQLIDILQNIFTVITKFINNAIAQSSYLKYQSQSFVYNNSPLKVNLVQSTQQYLQIDMDSIQTTSTEISYNLEWLENCISMGIQLLIFCNQHSNILQILNHTLNYNIPFSILKTLFDKLNKITFIQLPQPLLQTFLTTIIQFYTYFYDPQSFLLKIDQKNPYYQIFNTFVQSLPINDKHPNFNQILVLHNKITQEQLESTMFSIQQATARSFLELLSSIFYDPTQKSQTCISLTGFNLQILLLLQFIENKPQRIFGLLEQLNFEEPINELCLAILMHVTLDSQLLSQSVSIFSRNFKFFNQISNFIDVSKIDQTSLRGMKQSIGILLRAKGFG